MPTTATVAPGLRELADFLDTNPDVLALRRNAQVSVHLSYILIDADAVQAVARLLGTEVTTTITDGSTHSATPASFGGLEVSFFAISDAPRVLHRDPEATAILAERDA